jgi:hypothetical protein
MDQSIMDYNLTEVVNSQVKEVKLSRALATAIDEMNDHSVLPVPVRKAFQELYNFYQWQMENNLP